jgi:AcrR family transcriptional regulator
MHERILETTDRLFYGQGIRAVGVDTIAAEVGISKRDNGPIVATSTR